MKITARQLRQLIREVLLHEGEDETQAIPPSERYKNLTLPALKTTTGARIEPSFWDEAIDTLLPGTPVEDGYEIINTFSDIVSRRLQYNKQHNLPPETKTQEEIVYREKLLRSTPYFGYPDSMEFLDVIENIKTGKDVRPDSFRALKNKRDKSGELKYKSDEDVNARLDSREELKRMWLDIDEPGGDTKGYWVKSEFKPAAGSDPKAVYYKPAQIPTLTTQEFDELYRAIMSTKRPDGTFPGGNSDTVMDEIDAAKIKPTKVQSLSRSELGHYKFGAGQEGGRMFISIYDEWDLFPPALVDAGIDIQQFGKIPLIYYRIYR